MEKLKSSVIAKTIGVALALASALVALACGVATVLLYDWNAYDGEASFYDAQIVAQRVRLDANDIYNELYGLLVSGASDDEVRARIEEKWGEDTSNLAFELALKNDPDNVLFANFKAPLAGYAEEFTFGPFTDEDASESEGLDDAAGSGGIVIRCALREPLAANDKYLRMSELFERAVSLKYELLIAAALSLALNIGMFVFCMSAAGHKRNPERIEGGFFTKWPLDALLALSGVAFTMLVSLPAAWSYGFGSTPADIIIYAFALAAAALIALLTLMDFAVRVKLGRWWENSLIYRALRLLKRIAVWLLRQLKGGVSAIPLAWQTALIAAGAIIAEAVLCSLWLQNGSLLAFALLALFGLAVTAVLSRAAAEYKKIAAAADAIASGDLETRIDALKMPRGMRRLGESLNNIGEGMNAALEQRMKSERLRADLITNVSHDIKTPLTSIINYTDLLKGEKLPKRAAEYVEVLERQSARLKKLTNDLVEASKAATGNIAVSLERADLRELAAQGAGEYAERLEASGLTPVITAPESGVYALADGQLVWRIFDNLLSNACKYSQRDTRLYIDLTSEGERAAATFKNISKAELNVDADELMERFVRADSARSGEGSGLGLNIAKSLAELQGGALSLSVDGDLFKARLELPAYSETDNGNHEKA